MSIGPRRKGADAVPISLNPDIHPWEQQPGETAIKYARFLAFRNLGRLRTLQGATRALTATGDKVHYSTIKYYAHLYKWTERVQAWDIEQDKIDQERTRQERQEAIERQKAVASALLRKGLAAIRYTSAEDTHPETALKMIKLGSDLEYRALGEPTQTISLTGPAGGPIQTEDLTGLTPEERKQRLRDVVGELARRAGMSATTSEDEDNL